MRRSWAVGAGLLVLAAACGSDDVAGPASPSVGHASALADRAGVQAPDVVAVICEEWTVDQGDRPSINEYVHDLFLPLDAVNGPNPPAYSTEDVDDAVTRGCADHADDPDALLEAVRGELDLSEAELNGQIAAACERYRTQQARIEAGDWSGEDLAELIRELAAGRGVELAALRTAIDGVCDG